jgi:hypothetical protein
MAGMGAPGGGATDDNAAPDYTNPVGAARAFMAAARRKDLTALAEATAIRAPLEAQTASRRQLWQAIKDENLPAEDLDTLARAFDGMEVLMLNNARSTMARSVSVGKQEDNKLIRRTITVRKEKDGWKVMEVSDARTETVGISQRGRNNQANPNGR